jgi:hypothetical protein
MIAPVQASFALAFSLFSCLLAPAHGLARAWAFLVRPSAGRPLAASAAEITMATPDLDAFET